MTLYGLDPGTEQSALVCVDTLGRVTGHIWPNEQLVGALRDGEPLNLPAHLVIEEIQCYGMAVGREVFDTVFWAGRFAEAWLSRGAMVSLSMLPRIEVKLTLCGSMRAKDTNIRTALLDRYGGKAAAKKGGPLYGISSHMWAALAVAVTYSELQIRGVATA